ncbi:MAG: PilZ domain-containing protein, partial [Pseudomonadota bacterium]|nr:PilZ domain-containing protein [Pseudomonadota bacterium]
MLTRERIGETGFSLSRRVPKPERERRRDERQLTILRVGVLVVEGERELCLIRNISAGGLMAHVYREVRKDQRVTVELKSGQQIGGRVVWTAGRNAGIAFDAPIDVAELLANPPRLANGWRPRLPRVEVDRLATLRVGAGMCWVQVRDVSQGGVKLEVDRPLETGAEVVV